MRKILKFGWPVAYFMLCAAASALLPAWLIRSLCSLISLFGPLVGMNHQTISQATEIVSQLQYARICPPYLPILACGAIIGGLCTLLFRRRKHKIAIRVILGLVLLTALTPASLWLTEVNGIRTGALLSGLFPLLSALL